MTNDEIDLLLIRHFSGDLSADDRSRLERWIAEDPERGEELERLRDLWEASASPPTPPDVEAALARFKEHVDAREPAVVELPGRPYAPSPARTPRGPLSAHGRGSRSVVAHSRTRAWRIAAAIAVLLGGGLLWRTVFQDRLQAPLAMRTYATARAERATLTLPDGSTMMLNAETTVEVPSDFGERAREVQLRGEAYFDVVRNVGKPFRVRTDRAVTEVLGTKFNVRARPEDVSVQVAVVEGRVALGPEAAQVGGPDADSSVVLTAGQLGRVDGDGSVSRIVGADVSALSSWTEGRLVFERAPLPDVLVELGRWYDHDFVLRNDSLAELRLTTELRGRSITEAIQVLEAALDVRCRVADRTVTCAPAG